MTISSFDPGKQTSPDITNDYRVDIDQIAGSGWRANVTTVLGFLDVVNEMVGYELAEYERLVDKQDSWTEMKSYLNEAADGGNTIAGWGAKITSTSFAFGGRAGVTIKTLLQEMGFSVDNSGTVSYTLSSGAVTTLIGSDGKIQEDKLESAMGAEIDHLSGQVQTQSVRVNSLTGKSGDGAGNLASLMDELYQMVLNYINKMKA